MRARRNRAERLEQRQLARHRAAIEIEFGDLRGVPQRNKGALAVSGDGESDRVYRGDGLALRKIEALFDRARRGIEQDNIVGKIFGDQ